jgi:small-conductance mechanosensitive channel
MKRIRTSLEAFSANHPIKLAVMIFLGAAGIIALLAFLLGFYYKAEFWENILVEAHGMLFDLLVIGVFVYWLNSLGNSGEISGTGLQGIERKLRTI